MRLLSGPGPKKPRELIRFFARPAPVAPVSTDPNFDKVSLLLPLTADIKDYGPLGFSTKAVGNAAISGGSLLLDGGGDYVQVGADSAFSFGADQFSLELEVSFPVLPSTAIDGILISKWADTGSSGSGEFLFYYNATLQQVGFDFRSTAVTYQSAKSAVVAIPINTWTYIALTRNGSTWTFNVGGNISTATNSNAIKAEADQLEIGAIVSGAANAETQCRIRTLRITKGLARDISSVPAMPFATAWTLADSIKDRLLAWFDFDEASGNAIDKTGRYPLALSGSAASVTGILGTARSVPGTDGDYLFSNEWVWRGGDQPLYIKLRVKFNSFSGDPSFCGRYGFDNNSRSYMFQVNASGILSWIISKNGLSGAGNSGVATWGTALVAGNWYQIEGYYDPTAGHMGLSLNGGPWIVSAHTGGFFDGLTAQAFSLNRMNLPASAFGTSVNGVFDQFAAWRKAPTPALRALARAGIYEADYTEAAETTALLAALTGTYNAARRAEINNLIKHLKSAGVWTRLDVLCLAGLNVADNLINWKSPGTLNSAIVGSLTFTADRGLTGTGPGNRINTGFVPSAAGQNYSQNSATIGVYRRDAQAAENIYEWDMRSGSNYTSLAPRWTDNRAYYGLHGAELSVANTATQRLLLVTRTSSTAVAFYRDGVLRASSSANNSTTPPSGPLLLAQRAGTELSAWLAGGSVSAEQQFSLNLALSAYLDCIGASV